MGGLIVVVGFLFGLAGFLSVTNLTEAGLNIAKLTQIHTLTFLSSYPAGWVYLVLGILLMAIGGAFRGRRYYRRRRTVTRDD